MPVVRRAEENYARLFPFADVAVNLATLTKTMTAGIAKELADLHPKMLESYKTACEDGTLSLESPIHTYRDDSMAYTIVNMVTKSHWADGADLSLIRKGLEALKAYLLDKPNLSVVMPMLGAGNSNRSYEETEPLIKEVLDDLPNVIQVSMRPSHFEKPLRYLAVVGSRKLTQEHLRPTIKMVIEMQLEAWGLTQEDFEAWISGGAPGIDTFACGKSYTDDSYEKSLAKELHPRKPVIVQANWNEYKKTAGFIRNQTVADIATHVIALKSNGEGDNVGTTMMINLVEKLNTVAKVSKPEKPVKELAVFTLDTF